jgi:hypothetical protein
MALDAGFETVEQWRTIGNRLQLGMTITGGEKLSPGYIAKNLAFTVGEMTSLDKDQRLYAEVIRAYTEDELKWFAENRPRFLKATRK